MKLELDGRSKDGFTSIGTGFDIDCDWSVVASGGRIPLDDDSVDEVFGSHFLQRYTPFRGILNEICRVCKVGAKVELHTPHWLNSMSQAEGQRYTFTEQQVHHLTRDFIHNGQWTGKKRFSLSGFDRVAGPHFKEAQGIFPHLTDDQIMRFIPEACHELQFRFLVIEHK